MINWFLAKIKEVYLLKKLEVCGLFIKVVCKRRKHDRLNRRLCIFIQKTQVQIIRHMLEIRNYKDAAEYISSMEKMWGDTLQGDGGSLLSLLFFVNFTFPLMKGR